MGFLLFEFHQRNLWPRGINLRAAEQIAQGLHLLGDPLVHDVHGNLKWLKWHVITCELKPMLLTSKSWYTPCWNNTGRSLPKGEAFKNCERIAATVSATVVTSSVTITQATFDGQHQCFNVESFTVDWVSLATVCPTSHTICHSKSTAWWRCLGTWKVEGPWGTNTKLAIDLKNV